MTIATTNTKRLHAWDYKEFRAKYAPWAPDTNDAVDQEIVVRLWEPTGARGFDVPTGTHFFSELFFQDKEKLWTQKRLEYCAMLDDQSIPRIAAVAHRGFGKTVISTVWSCRQLLCRFSRHILYTSSEEKIAVRRTNGMRAKLTNKDLASLFGNFKPLKNNKHSATFSVDGWYLVDPKTQVPFAAVSPRGSGQTVNGSIVILGDDWVRVDLILNDDGQSRKHIGNKDVRDVYEDWLDAELSNTIDVRKQPDHKTHKWNLSLGERAPWRNVMFDTPKHRECAITKFQRRPEWFTFNAPLAKEVEKGVYVTAHPGYMDDAGCMYEYKRNILKPDYWTREFLCLAQSRDTQHFTRDMFQHVDAEVEVKKRRGRLTKFLVVDPAHTTSEQSAKTSMLAVCVDIHAAQVIFAENMVGRWEPPVYYQHMFALCRKWGITRCYVEETGATGTLRNAIMTAASMAGLYGQIDFTWLKSIRNPNVDYIPKEDSNSANAMKIARSGGLLPYYQQKLILHDNSMKEGPLEGALIDWPECSEWDATDTAGYVPEIFEAEDIYLEGEPAYQTILDQDESEEFEECGRWFRSKAWQK